MENNFISEENQNEEFNLVDSIDRYVGLFRWFVLSVIVCFGIAFVYLRYAIPQYKGDITILVKDDKKGNGLSELSAFSDLGLGKKSNFDNEIEILKSRTLIEKTVQSLGLTTSLTGNGDVISSEIYIDTPIEVHFVNIKPGFSLNSMSFEYSESSPTTFELKNEYLSSLEKGSGKFKYGESIAVPYADLIITKKPNAKNNYNTITISVSPLDEVAKRYMGKLTVNPINKSSSIVQVSMVDPLIKRSEYFLNNMIKIYNEAAAEDKNFISQNTSTFISERLLLITKELDGVEKDVESFKTVNKLTDISDEAKLFIAGSEQYNRRNVDIEIQLNVVNSMIDFLKKSSNFDLLPTNIISKEIGGDSSGNMDAFNALILERNRILKTATPENPAVIILNQQIMSLRQNISEGLKRLLVNLNIQKRNVQNQESLIDSKIQDIPSQEREFRFISRQQEVKEKLYLYLLEKREETAISLAATEPNARVVDAAKTNKQPVSPNRSIIYLVSIMLGLVIPYGVIFIYDLFDTKVKSRFDIFKIFAGPFLGEVPRSITSNELIDTSSRTATAEAIRIVKSNLDFMLSNVSDYTAKVILVTSTVAGEGKTFISVNLANTIALSNKKTLLVGMDFRNPRISDYIGTKDSRGLTDYLSSGRLPIEDYIFKSKDCNNLYVLPAGVIPPNPTELLVSKKLQDLFMKFKNEYDYIVVDMAPVSLVSDTLILSKFADVTVYVIRSGFLDKRMLHVPKLLYKEEKLNNMAVVLNDTRFVKGYGYGYSYGYGTNEEKISWYKKIFKF